jgi:glyoxylase-like metal-dependent hydrolase (beta-lactamase superfamily II)
LLDLGEKEFLSYKPVSVFITHLHPDHAFFVTGSKLTAGIPVYAPENSEETTMVMPSYTIHLGNYRITSIPTVHSKLVKSLAYLIEDGEQSLLYTGDMIWINKEYHQLLVSLIWYNRWQLFPPWRYGQEDDETGLLYGHNGIPELIKLFHRFTQHILFVHFGNCSLKILKNPAETGKLGKDKRHRSNYRL